MKKIRLIFDENLSSSAEESFTRHRCCSDASNEASENLTIKLLSSSKIFDNVNLSSLSSNTSSNSVLSQPSYRDIVTAIQCLFSPFKFTLWIGSIIAVIEMNKPKLTTNR